MSFATSKEAAAAILARDVRLGAQAQEILDKPGTLLKPDVHLTVLSHGRFVSRGGEKLKGALSTFCYDVEGRRAIDVGSSTGGFTDCLLSEGATSVCAVDVGYGQLAWKLRSDSRVSVFERTNIRTVDVDSLGAPFDLVVADLSFISLETVLDALLRCISLEGDLILLVKPQFEAEKIDVGARGVVRDADVHVAVLEHMVSLVRAAQLTVKGLTYSPITGPEGNIEFWIWARRGDDAQANKQIVDDLVIVPVDVVMQAHKALKR